MLPAKSTRADIALVLSQRNFAGQKRRAQHAAGPQLNRAFVESSLRSSAAALARACIGPSEDRRQRFAFVVYA